MSNDEELHKANMDFLIYGTGAYKKEGDEITHIPLQDIYKSAAEMAKEYLISCEVWDEDYWICAMKIAQQIIKDSDHGANDYDAVKGGRRMMMALCDVYSDQQKVKP